MEMIQIDLTTNTLFAISQLGKANLSFHESFIGEFFPIEIGKVVIQ